MHEDEFLTKIGDFFRDDYPHIARRDPEIPLEEWNTLGCPYMWLLIQRCSMKGPAFAELWSDQGYGWLALVVNGEIVDVGKDQIQGPDHCVVALSEYYGLKRATLFTKVEGGRP